MMSRGDLHGALQQFQAALEGATPLLSKEHQLQGYPRYLRAVFFKRRFWPLGP